ncbi:DUF4962 domain-containing protein [Cetobacterium sp.]|uniref:DUF4962 domain-containing protein n=1 Tax=Cetobacterium sp. TaxID=2071632 RepID=UPI003EE61FDC
MDTKKYIFLGNKLPNLKESILEEKEFLFKRLYEQCSLYKKINLTEEHPKGSSTFMSMGALNLSLAFILTKQNHYLEDAKKWIFTGVNYSHWGHAHLVDVDLSASWLLFGYALCYDWLKDDLNDNEKKQLKNKLILQGTRMYDFSLKTVGEGWSTNYWQNHNWINFTGLAAAGYALKDEYPLANEWIEYSKNNFSKVFSYMPEDGSDYEGVVYWRYGVIWLYIYAHLLKERENINFFEKSDFLKNTFFYRLYQSTPNLEEIINFGDCHDRRSGHSPAIYFKVASEYNNGYAQNLGKLVVDKFLFREQYESGIKPGILPEAWLELLWFNPKIATSNFNDLPLVKYWEDLGLVVIKNNWKEDGISFSFKCGAPGGKKQWNKSWELDKTLGWKTRGLSHQHPDNNSFIIHGHGSFLAVDDGYNRDVKACEHNTILVDNSGYISENQNNIWKETEFNDVGEMKTFINENNFTYAVGESAKSYEKLLQLKEFKRHILNTGERYFYIIDELNSNIPHTYSWLLHSDVKGKFKENKIEILNGPGSMDIYTFTPTETSKLFYDTYVKAVMTTQEPDKFRETNMKTIKLSNVAPEKSITFINLLDIKNSLKNSSLKIAHSHTQNLDTVVIENEDYNEYFYFNRNTKIDIENISTDAKILVLKKTKENLTLLASECTYLEYKNNTLYKGEKTTFTRKVITNEY